MSLNGNRYQGKPCKYGHSGIRYKSSRQCVDCMAIKALKYYHEGEGRKLASDRHIFKKYNITREQFNIILRYQNGNCAICEQPVTLDRTSTGAVVDHNHKTGQVRGILCNNCNRGLGMFEDSPSRLENAAEYAIRNIPEDWLE